MALKAPLRATRLATWFVTMPKVYGKTKEVYIESYGVESYNLYLDTSTDTYHGGKYDECFEDDDDSPRFTYRPDHDVESIFWILTHLLLLSKPLDVSSENMSVLGSILKTLHTDTIAAASPFDSRDQFLRASERDWKRFLHPRFSSLARLMAKLACQVSPEYGLLDPPPPQDHLHEAFRRILLGHILSMADPIPLTPPGFQTRG